MRQSYGGNIIYNKNNEFVGVNLGADFCAEHEWGIQRMCTRLGVANNSITVGVDRRKITKGESVDGGQVTIKKKKYFYIYSENINYLMDKDKITLRKIMDGLHMYPGEMTLEKYGFMSFWDEGGFQLLFDEKYIEFGKELLNAIKTNDALLFVGKTSNPFSRGGLNVVILSRMDEEVLNEMKEKDEDQKRLAIRAVDTGIFELLKKAGKRYFALTPRWKDEKKKEVVFWLNPMEQHLYNFGWFSVKELQLWAKDKGPVMKKENGYE